MENIIKKLKGMREQVKEELNHIPRGNLNQNMLRQIYWSLRMHSLGKKGAEKSKEEVLVEATKLVRKDDPSFHPKFDKSFFKIKKIKKLLK